MDPPVEVDDIVQPMAGYEQLLAILQLAGEKGRDACERGFIKFVAGIGTVQNEDRMNWTRRNMKRTRWRHVNSVVENEGKEHTGATKVREDENGARIEVPEKARMTCKASS